MVARKDAVKRFDVYLVTLDPTRGSEIKKTRPRLVISPDEMNRHIRTVIMAPMTTRSRPASESRWLERPRTARLPSAA